MKQLFFILLVILAGFTATQCTYHNVEDQFGSLETSCDTSAVSYELHLAPVLQANCVSCHNSSNPSGGMALGDHVGLVQAANSGRLLGAVKHESGFSPMPQGAAPLADCEIAQLEAWISQGLKNN